jgi:hypothetical protein
MHAANPETSSRLKRMLYYLRQYPAGATTLELQRWTDSCAVHTDIAELRAAGHVIERKCQGKNKNGRWINVYRYCGRVK